MDFTFLFIVILMLLASQSGAVIISGALFVALLVQAKDKYLLFSALVGGAIVILNYLQVLDNTFLILGGLFVVLLLLVREDSVHPQPAYGGGGGY